MQITGDAALAREILIHGPLSRNALAARLGLSPASLTRLARPLLESGILVELPDVVDGSIGRPTRPLAIAPEVGSFVGVKLTGTHLYAVATDVRATVRAAADVAIRDRTPESVIELIARTVEEFDLPDLSGVGVSVGGYVHENTIAFAPFLGWYDVALAAPLVQRLAAPVTVENDLVALAEAERWFGMGRNLDGFAVITIGAGVGYALVVGEHVVRTPDAAAGTGGHIPLSATGPLCPEGHRGCSRAMLTSDSIANQVAVALGRSVTFEEVLDLAAAHDPAARAVVDAAGEALGNLIAMAANLTLQPSIVLAGDGIGLYRLVAAQVDKVIATHRDPRAQRVTVHVDTDGFSAWARGAAAVSIQTAMLSISGVRTRGRQSDGR